MDHAELQQLLQRFQITPSRSKGQNFLLDESVVERMVALAGVNKNDLVIEIGPGLGVLTKVLCQTAKAVLSMELDHNAVAALRAEVVPRHPNLTLWEGDALSGDAFHARIDWLAKQQGSEVRLDPKSENYRDQLQALDQTYKIVANLPYQITSRFLRTTLEALPRPSQLVVMVQKEVAERATAKPGQMSLLTLAVQAYSTASIAFVVPSAAFYPEPEVQSAVMVCDLSNPQADYAALDDNARAQFWRLAKAGFASRRKQLKNNLLAAMPGKSIEDISKILEGLGKTVTVRAQELSVSDWCALVRQSK
ncbi:MAG: ribosomal RNA small subunit methyltransferase A [Parcubacteria group bacterium]|nr:ribosomal RNA small subunit methyltransferase A [Parcubacteria group bacterium]